MTANFLKDYMDLDEFLAVKDLCTGLSRTESDYSEDEIEQDIVNLVDDEDVPPFYSFPPSNIPQLSPDCFGGSTSDTDEGRGDSVSSENPASLSSCESHNSNETERAFPKKRKRKSTTNNNNDAQKTSAPRRRRRKADDLKEKRGTATVDYNEGKQPRKISRQTVNEDVKDEKYWERRRKNNQAAKRSRDLKRQKELCVAERAALLEDENRQLREEVQKLRDYLKTLDEKMDKSSTDSQ